MGDIDIKYSLDPVESLIIVGQDNYSSAQSLLKEMLSGLKKPYAFIDRRLMQNSPAVVELGVALQEMKCPMWGVDTSEGDKSMETIMKMASWLLDRGADRDATLIAIGGGITTDMVGFLASIYKRGVRYISVPTTLLSQIDAGLGGKTGVNFMGYKNMLGTVHQPMLTFICPEFIKTLPRRDFLSGISELLKTFIIDNSSNCYKAVTEYLRIYQSQSVPSEIMKAAATVKSQIVSRDPFEKGERRKLNLGHTFAHAIESLAQNNDKDITHGEAVAMGIILAAQLAEKMTATKKFDAELGLAMRLETDFVACGLSVQSPFSIKELAPAMLQDKKAECGKIHFVLPRTIGDVEIVDLTIKEAVNYLSEM